MNTMQTRFSVLQPPHSSSDTSIFCLPSVRTHSLGQISFPYAAPSVWSTHTHTHSTLAFWAIQAGLLTPLTFVRHRLSPLAAFSSGAYFLPPPPPPKKKKREKKKRVCNSEFANFTLPTLKAFLEARSQNVILCFVRRWLRGSS